MYIQKILLRPNVFEKIEQSTSQEGTRGFLIYAPNEREVYVGEPQLSVTYDRVMPKIFGHDIESDEDFCTGELAVYLESLLSNCDDNFDSSSGSLILTRWTIDKITENQRQSLRRQSETSNDWVSLWRSGLDPYGAQELNILQFHSNVLYVQGSGSLNDPGHVSLVVAKQRYPHRTEQEHSNATLVDSFSLAFPEEAKKIPGPEPYKKQYGSLDVERQEILLLSDECI